MTHFLHRLQSTLALPALRCVHSYNFHLPFTNTQAIKQLFAAASQMTQPLHLEPHCTQIKVDNTDNLCP